MIQVMEDRFSHEEQLAYRRVNIPHEDNCELQVIVYERFVCLAVVDYEVGEVLVHVDYPAK